MRRPSVYADGQTDGLDFDHHQKYCPHKAALRGQADPAGRPGGDDLEETTPSFDRDSEEAVALEQAMKVLGDQERQILILHAVTGLKHREIAEMLGMPLATVLSKYARSLKKLKKALEEDSFPNKEVQ